MELNEILQIALRGGASDIHLKAGLPPMFRVDGSLVPLKDGKRLPPEEVARMAFGIMNEFQKEKFKQSNEVDLAYGVPGLGRFRVNVFQQRGTVGAVLRVIPFKVMTIKELLLPPILEKICLDERGLVLVTGTTGSGKSTTLAAMIDHINATETNHIMTIEDPIEFLIRDKRSIVNQREVGVDTMSFAQALKSALRQDPDVILVGEMRDHETIETALAAAETGHLVMSTLHTLDATETINRIVSAFPPYQQKQVRIQLASVLKAVVSQRLIPRADGKGRVAAVEVLRCTARVKELIEDKDRTKEIPDAISQGFDTYGMQTFDQSLMSLVKQGLVTYEEAHRQATNPDDFALRFSGISATSDSKWDNFEANGAAKPVPGSASFGQNQQPTPAPVATPARAVPTPSVARPGVPAVSPASRPGMPAAAAPPTSRAGIPTVAAPRPAAPAPAPAAAPKAPAPADDDFQIERF
ncbi:type IV pilus twitching motility protein PilT [Archangium violaceum]|uniref:type IV pilus twitching motility protein PilT n=1 Tax=Archangium violaceum TaxID=83451 RepID=UPI00194ED649|nr:type IV pilus twitching motility protein PilT [Archangium violaceum]QRN94833.1 type IV pilus twitching motility protein PilT [Archangium violaceum]